MNRITFLLALLSVEHAFAAPSLDLTPVAKSFPLEGAVGHCVEFQSYRPERPVRYSPAWPLQGAGDKASFAIPLLGATGDISRCDTARPLDLADDAAVVDFVKSILPAKSENVQIVKTVRNPVFLNGQPTVEVQLTYARFGMETSQATVLARRASSDPSEIIRFQVETVHAEQFQKLDRALVASLYSVVGF